MPVENWFCTPVYYNYISDLENVQNELACSYKKCNFSKSSAWGISTHSVSDPTFSTNLIQQHQLASFENQIKLNVLQYLKQINSSCARNFKISSCWFTNTTLGQHTRIHNHRYADISGVYYYKTNCKDGSLVFVSPVPALSSMIYANSNDTVSYAPDIGKIILFPGWLYHTVDENETGDERISVSFNIYFER